VQPSSTSSPTKGPDRGHCDQAAGARHPRIDRRHAKPSLARAVPPREWRDFCLFEASTERLTLRMKEYTPGGVTAPAWNELAGAMHYIGSLVLILWLIIGVVAAGQRHDYTHPPANCNQGATIVVTILAGPLNYLGVDPQISCHHLPQPSK
jgi:hypothetical protein